MNTIKFILINIEMIMMIISFVLGTGIIKNNSFIISCILLFGPFVWAKLTNFDSQLHFYEVYERAWNISIKSSK